MLGSVFLLYCTSCSHLLTVCNALQGSKTGVRSSDGTIYGSPQTSPRGSYTPSPHSSSTTAATNTTSTTNNSASTSPNTGPSSSHSLPTSLKANGAAGTKAEEVGTRTPRNPPREAGSSGQTLRGHGSPDSPGSHQEAANPGGRSQNKGTF